MKNNKLKEKPISHKIICFILPNVLHDVIPGFGGQFNGYCALPKGHRYFGVDNLDIHDISIHGGLTFSGKSIIGQPKETKGMWILGFDTLHAGDTGEYWNNLRVMEETIKLYKQLCKIK